MAPGALRLPPPRAAILSPPPHTLRTPFGRARGLAPTSPASPRTRNLSPPLPPPSRRRPRRPGPPRARGKRRPEPCGPLWCRSPGAAYLRPPRGLRRGLLRAGEGPGRAGRRGPLPGCLPCGWRAAALGSARPLSARLGRARRRLRRGGRAGGEGGAELGAEWKRPSSPGRARRQHVTSLPERDPGKGGRERAAAAARRLGPAARWGRGLCRTRRGKGWRRWWWRRRRRRREGEARRGGARLPAAPPAAASAAARPPSAARGSACVPGAERRSRGPPPDPAPPYWSLPRPKAAIPRCRPVARPGLVVVRPGGPRSAAGLAEASRGADMGGFWDAEMERWVLGGLGLRMALCQRVWLHPASITNSNNNN